MAADTGFSDSMCRALRELRPELIKQLVVSHDSDLLAHLMSRNVFQTDEYILAERTRSGQVRKLLDDLARRPGADFFHFVMALYETAQGHVAERILQKYEARGGTVPVDVKRQRQDYLNQQQNRGNHQLQQHHHRLQQHHHRLQQQHGQQQNQLQQQSGAVMMEMDTAGDRQPRTLGGNYLCQNSVDPDLQIRESSRQPNARVTTRSPVMATEERDSRAAGLLHDGGDVITLTAYMRAKQVDPDGVYNADSMPRGHMLVIDNEYFDSPYIGNRDGTEQDSQILVDLFKNQLRYTVRVARDCSTQRMLEELKNFKKDLAQHQVDSCVVAILSHGGEGDIIFGCDGRVNERGTPVRGTYITTSDLRSMFSTHNCPAMRNRPKLFIIQACRGAMEDTAGGPHSLQLRRDVLPENPSDTPAHGPSFADFYFLFASVEDFVAYRGRFIQLLVKVFQEHAHKAHIKDMATKLHSEMRKSVVDGHIFSIGEEKGNLTKHWFFNPPAVHNT